MRNLNSRALLLIFIVSLLFFPITGHSSAAGKAAKDKAAKDNAARKADTRAYLTELMRLGASKPFLTDSIDVYLEPKSLNQFFTVDIYRKLQGNPYFGYRFDEGFLFDGKEIQIETLKDLTPKEGCAAGYRVALEKALTAEGLEIKPKAQYQVGVCIVGIEEKETAKTLPGVMVEAYLRNTQLKKSFFIRYGEGSSRGLAAAIRLSAELLISELQVHRKTNERKRT
jgi:hypothetical protein